VNTRGLALGTVMHRMSGPPADAQHTYDSVIDQFPV
jgi:hypothetical protein